MNKFYLEAGVLNMEYDIGFIANSIDIFVWPSMRCIQFPLLVKYKYNAYKKLFIVPKPGIVFGINNKKQMYSQKAFSQNDKFVVKADLNNDYYKKYFNLFQTGIDFELKFKHSSVIIGYDFVKSFSTLMNTKLEYKINESGSWINVTLIDDGGYMLYNLAYKINF